MKYGVHRMITVSELLNKIDREAKQKFGPNYRNWFATHDFPFAGGVFDISLKWHDDTIVTVRILENAVNEGLSTVQDLQRARDKAQAQGLWDRSVQLYSIQQAFLRP